MILDHWIGTIAESLDECPMPISSPVTQVELNRIVQRHLHPLSFPFIVAGNIEGTQKMPSLPVSGRTHEELT